MPREIEIKIPKSYMKHLKKLFKAHDEVEAALSIMLKLASTLGIQTSPNFYTEWSSTPDTPVLSVYNYTTSSPGNQLGYIVFGRKYVYITIFT